MFNEYMKIRKASPDILAKVALMLLRVQKKDADLCLDNSYHYHGKPVEITYPDLPKNCSITLEIVPDHFSEAPWDWCEGFGTIKLMQRYAENAGNGNIQVRSYGRENYYYNFAEALKRARMDYDNSRTGKADLQRKALDAVKREIKYFEGYICDDWNYVSVHVQAYREGEEVFDEWVGGCESMSWEGGALDLIHGAKREIFATKYAGSTVGDL